jgi:hypothetical protein
MKKILAAWATATLLGNAAFAQTFTLKSAELGGQLPNKQYLNGMGYTGENQSPQLT